MNLLQTFLASPFIHRLGCALLHFSWQGLLIAAILAVAMRMLRGRAPTGTEAPLWSRWSAGARYLTAWTALLAMAVSVPVTAWLIPPPPVTQLAGAAAEPPAGALPTHSDEMRPGTGVLDPIDKPRIASPGVPARVELPAVASSGSAHDAQAGTRDPLAVRASRWVRPVLPWVVCCWIAGALVLSLWRLSGWIHLRRLRHLGTSPVSGVGGQMLGRLLTRLRISREVRLLESVLIEVPTVIGWLRPVILLPGSILGELPAEQLELILAHELAHIRRHDFLWNLVQTAIETLLFYHPAVWWVSRQIRLEREACCDEVAVAGYPLGGGDRLLYARALTRLEELRHEPAGLLPARAGMAADGAPLLGRIRRVLGLPGNDDEGRRTWLAGSIGVLLLLGVLVGYAATAGEPQSKPVEADTRATGASGSSKPEKPRYAGEGLVVDDQTGKPVEQIAVQRGVPNASAESGIMWITMIQSPRGVRGGHFNITHNCVKEGKVRIRIVADGYLPEVAIVDTEDGLLKAPLVMRLRRGQAIRGRVVDHAGKPVAGAEVFLGGHDRHAEIVDGKPEGFGAKRETTDTDGRFVIHGAAPGEVNRLIVLAPRLHVWMAPVLELGKELTVRLPEPATLVIRYDIPGDVAEGRFRLELKTWDMPDWKGIVSSVQNPTAKNQAEVVLKNMTPGVYDVIRMKQLRVADRGTEAFCDRRDVTLESGKTTTLQFVRKKGYAIEGEVLGLEGTDIPGAFVFVRSPKATGDPRSRDDWKLPIYDGVTSGKDGKFKTAPIEPGEYLLVADAYEPQPRGMGFGMGWSLPAYVGKAKVTVPEIGPPPRVRIEMKPRPADQKVPPARAPAGTSAEATGEATGTKPADEAADPLARQVEQLMAAADQLMAWRNERCRAYLRSLSDADLAKLYGTQAAQGGVAFDIAWAAVRKDRQRIVEGMIKDGAGPLSQADEAALRQRREKLVGELAALGLEAVPILLREMQAGKPARASLAQAALMQMGGNIVEPLLKLWNSPGVPKEAVIDILDELADPRSKDIFLKAVDDESDLVRSYACGGLLRLGPEVVGRDRLQAILVAKLEDGSCLHDALSGLAQYGDPSAVGPLRVIAEHWPSRGKADLRRSVRLAIRQILQRAGQPVPEAFQREFDSERAPSAEELYAAAACSNRGIRRLAISRLSDHHDDRTARFLLKRLPLEPADDVVREIDRALGLCVLAPQNEGAGAVSASLIQEAFDALVAAARDSRDKQKDAAVSAARTVVYAAGRSKTPLEGVSRLKQLIRDGLRSDRREMMTSYYSAITAVATTAGTATAGWSAEEKMQLQRELLPRLQAARPDIRLIECLGHIGDQAAVPPLLKLLEHEDAMVRQFAASALGQIGDARAIPALRPLADSDPARYANGVYHVREAAARAIRAIEKRSPGMPTPAPPAESEKAKRWRLPRHPTNDPR